MGPGLTSSRKALFAGGLAGFLALAFLYGAAWSQGVRERVFDVWMPALVSVSAEAQPLVVDLDRESLAALSGGQLRRQTLAAIIGRLAEAAPRVIALDVLIEGEDQASPRVLAKRLFDLVAKPEFSSLAQSLPDDTLALIEAAKSTPLVFGLALDPEAADSAVKSAPMLVSGALDASGWWEAESVRGPLPQVAAAAGGVGVLALAGDDDAIVRRVPLVAIGGGQAFPGLALEALRRSAGASAYLVNGPELTIAVGKLKVPLGADGMLRLVPSDRAHRASRTISATRLMSEGAAIGARDRVVVVGSSAPELGGLRTAAGGELIASVQLQADAIAQLAAGIFPIRARSLVGFEAALAGLFVVAAALLGGLGSPVRGAMVVAAASLLWIGAAAGAFLWQQALADPIVGPAGAIIAYAFSAITMASETRRRAQSLQRRFEQHLAPAVVSRILANPDSLKLGGERREVTSLFTDLEGFTSLTERADPEALVALLDRYFSGVSAIVVAHGGMVDKFVGDAVHALFNVPLDLDQHTLAAFRCARAIDGFSREFAQDPAVAALGTIRTRIGLERGPAIVGDVGGGGKLDYTGYGTVINTAARLEAANKEVGSSILVGPVAAAVLDPELLRPTGVLSLRGRADQQATYSVWPAGYTPDCRARYREAVRLRNHEPQRALVLFQRLAAEHPDDGVVARFLAAT